jgi:Domain of unknown function (DUF4124)
VILGSIAHAESKKIVKWVDSNGVTHYGDKMPAQEADKKSSILTKEGVTIKKIDPNLKNSSELDAATAEQNRRDNALLGSYNSIEEIDIASKRNTQIDEFALQAIQQKIASLKSAQKQNTLDIAKDNKKSPEKTKLLLAEKQRLATEIAMNENKAVLKLKDIEAIRSRFEHDKIRYAELKPRNESFTDIKNKRKTLAELEQWKRDALAKLEFYQNEATRYKRANGEVPGGVKDGIQNASNEVARADEAILAALVELRSKEKSFSKGAPPSSQSLPN